MRSPSNAVLTYFLVFAVLLTWHQGEVLAAYAQQIMCVCVCVLCVE